MNTDKDQIYSELLLIRYRRGDDSALEELIRYWEKRLFYYISRLVDNEEDAWDALQDTWVALVRNIRKLRKPRSLVMWLYTIARNSAMNKLRARYSDNELLVESGKMVKVGEQTEKLSFEDAHQVHQAMQKLSLPHREVLTLSFLEDFSIDEISKVLSISSGTVKSRLHYAKRALRAILEEEEIA